MLSAGLLQNHLLGRRVGIHTVCDQNKMERYDLQDDSKNVSQLNDALTDVN